MILTTLPLSALSCHASWTNRSVPMLKKTRKKLDHFCKRENNRKINSIVFLITSDHNMSEKPLFVGVIRNGSRWSIASDYFLRAKSWSESKSFLLGQITVEFPIVISPQYHKILFLSSKMIDRAIDLHDACRITPTNHGFSVMLSPKVIRKIKTFDFAAIGGPTDSKELFSAHFQHLTDRFVQRAWLTTPCNEIAVWGSRTKWVIRYTEYRNYTCLLYTSDAADE